MLDRDSLFNQKEQLIKDLNQFLKNANELIQLNFRSAFFQPNRESFVSTRKNLITRCRTLSEKFYFLGLHLSKQDKEQSNSDYSHSLEVISLGLEIPINKNERVGLLLCFANILLLTIKNNYKIGKENFESISEEIVNKVKEDIQLVQKILDDKMVREVCCYYHDINKQHEGICETFEKMLDKISSGCESLTNNSKFSYKKI